MQSKTDLVWEFIFSLQMLRAPQAFRCDAFRDPIAVWSPDGRKVASYKTVPIYSSYLVRIWSMQPECQLEHTFSSPNPVSCMAWSFFDDLLAVGTADATVRIYNTRQLVVVLQGHQSRITSLAWSPVKQQLLAAEAIDTSVRLFEFTAQKWQSRTFRDRAIVESVHWSPDGLIMASVANWDFSRVIVFMPEVM
jgi:WD40 repeat protein